MNNVEFIDFEVFYKEYHDTVKNPENMDEIKDTVKKLAYDYCGENFSYDVSEKETKDEECYRFLFTQESDKEFNKDFDEDFEHCDVSSILYIGCAF